MKKQSDGAEASESTFVLTTTAHWKAVSHPLRTGILRLLTEHTLTNEELADALEVESGKLYFHTKYLLDAGLIKIIETRSKGPITEKVYKAVAQHFVANELPDTQADDPPPFDGVVAGFQAFYRQTWRKHAPMTGRAHYAYHFTKYIPRERAAEFITKLKAFVDEFAEIETDETNIADARKYSLGLLFHAVPSDPSSDPNAASNAEPDTDNTDDSEKK
jgi:DNA-binding transcriptional ArsR family regulator